MYGPETCHHPLTTNSVMTILSLQGKITAVTGGASGTGLATMHALLSCGAPFDVDDKTLDAAKGILSTAQWKNALFQHANVADRSAVEAFLTATSEHFGKPLDRIASVAGTAGHHLSLQRVWETETDEYDFVLNVNVRGTSKVLVEGLKLGVFSEPGGSVVCVGSMFSSRGFQKGAHLSVVVAFW